MCDYDINKNVDFYFASREPSICISFFTSMQGLFSCVKQFIFPLYTLWTIFQIIDIPLIDRDVNIFAVYVVEGDDQLSQATDV